MCFCFLNRPYIKQKPALRANDRPKPEKTIKRPD